VNFLVNAQLSARLAQFLSDAGHDALHTTELPDGTAQPTGELPSWPTSKDGS